MAEETSEQLRAVASAREQLDRLLGADLGCVRDFTPIQSVIALYASFPDEEGGHRCAECEAGYVDARLATDHVPACTGHPALRRARAARDALELCCSTLKDPGSSEVLAASTALTTLELPQAIIRPYVSAGAADHAIRTWMGWSRHSAGDEQLTEAADLLEALFEQCERVLTGVASPCPFCSATVPLEAAEDHLWSCVRHPAFVLAAGLEAKLVGAVGGERADVLLEVAGRRHQLRHGLRLLIRATSVYRRNMGWDGEHAYSKHWSERPWLAAQGRAAKLIAYGRAPRSPATGAQSPTRQALERGLARVRNGERVADSDAALLREANEQLNRWIAAHGLTARCPCCRREGVHPGRIGEHLKECHARPTRVELSSLRAEARYFSAELPLFAFARRVEEGTGEAPAVLALSPRNPLSSTRGPFPRFESSLHRRRVEALERLLSAAPRLIGEDERDLQEWATDAESYPPGGRCEACRKFFLEEDALIHQLWCPAHPELAEIRKLDALLAPYRGRFHGPIANVVRESEAIVSTIAALLDACDTFWNGMRDGERGKSISTAEADAMLHRAIWDAAAVAAMM